MRVRHRLHDLGLAAQLSGRTTRGTCSTGACRTSPGSHNIKFGYTHEIGPDGRMDNEYNGDHPAELQRRPAEHGHRVQHAARTPPGIVEYDAAFFVQDSWTIKRLTLNPGLRVEWFAAGMEETSAPPAGSRRRGSSRRSTV